MAKNQIFLLSEMSQLRTAAHFSPMFLVISRHYQKLYFSTILLQKKMRMEN